MPLAGVKGVCRVENRKGPTQGREGIATMWRAVRILDRRGPALLIRDLEARASADYS